MKYVLKFKLMAIYCLIILCSQIVINSHTFGLFRSLKLYFIYDLINTNAIAYMYGCMCVNVEMKMCSDLVIYRVAQKEIYGLNVL